MLKTQYRKIKKLAVAIKFKSSLVNNNYIITVILSIGIIIFLLFNTYKTIHTAEINYSIKLKEEKKLEEIKNENKELNEKLKYLQSNDAKELLALEAFKLAKENETLYKITDSNSNDVIYVKEENLDPINLENNVYWWKFIFFHF